MTSTSRHQGHVLLKCFFDWTGQDATGFGQDGEVQDQTGQDKDRQTDYGSGHCYRLVFHVSDVEIVGWIFYA